LSLILHKYLLILNFCLCFISGQTLKLEIKEYRPFPAEIDLLELKPTKFNWSIGNRFILLDEVKNQLLEINLSGKLNLPTGDGIENSVYGQIIWMGVAPEGIRVVDRLENEILHLDYRLNSIQKTLIDPRLYPEMVTMNSWGIMYLYSKTYNAIYSFERSRINSIPFIDLSKERLPSNCFIDMASNDNGDLGLLSCAGTIYVFSQNGKMKLSSPCNIKSPEHIIPFRDDWLILNNVGKMESMESNKQYAIPASSIPILDVQSINKAIVVLAQDHILIIDVE
jgi:hypothetical protein